MIGLRSHASSAVDWGTATTGAGVAAESVFFLRFGLTLLVLVLLCFGGDLDFDRDLFLTGNVFGLLVDDRCGKCDSAKGFGSLLLLRCLEDFVLLGLPNRAKEVFV